MRIAFKDNSIKSKPTEEILQIFESEFEGLKISIEALKLSSRFLGVGMDGSVWMFKEQSSSFPRTIYSSEMAARTKKDHDIKLIGRHKFELVDQKAHDRLIKKKKGAKLKTEDKIFLLKIMTVYYEEHDHIRSIYHLSS